MKGKYELITLQTSYIEIMRKSDKLTYVLSKAAITILIIFYLILILIGIALSIKTILKIASIEYDDILLHTVISSLAVCAMLSGIQYLKRLYKALISGRVMYPVAKYSSEEVGNMIYFVSRPIFSFVFVIIFIFCILSGFAIVTGSLDYVVNVRFLYLCVISSSCIGYSFGHILDRFEKYSIVQIDKTFNVMEGDKVE